MVYIGRTPLLGWSVVTLSRIPFISTVNTIGTHWLKGEKLEMPLFFMAGDEEGPFMSLQEAVFERKIQNTAAEFS